MNRPLCSICKISLSTKQRLHSHMKSKHQIESYEPCYKLYKSDPSKAMPVSTYYRKVAQSKGEPNSLHVERSLDECSSSTSYTEQSETEQDQSRCISQDTISNAEMKTVEFQENTTGNTQIIQRQYASVEATSRESEVENSLETERGDIGSVQETGSDFDSDTYSQGDFDSETESDSDKSSDGNDSPDSDFSDNSKSDLRCLTEDEEIHMSILAYTSRHCLNKEASADLLKLFSLCSDSKVINVSNDKLKETLGTLNSNIHDFCVRCQKLFPKDESVVHCSTEQCPGLRYKGKENEQLLKRRQSFFVSTDVASQIKDILEKENMFQTMKNYKQTCSESESITDILNGEYYKKVITDEDSTCANITLTFNTDGVPLYNSSKVSIWPVYLVINELPPSSRFSRQNMIVWGVWQAKGKPNFHTFLKPFVRDMIQLRNDGLLVRIENEEIHVKASLIAGSLDLQAKAMVLDMTHHNGEYGCSTCEESGQVVTQGRGYARVYPYRNEKPSLRKSEDILQCGLEAARRNVTVKGVKGVSVLHALEWLCLVVCIVPDYMHGVLLGMTKKLLTLFFSPANSEKNYFLGKYVKDIDKLLLKMRPTDAFHRLPRHLEQNFHHYKAAELQNWLLFYSLPCLIGFLSEENRNHLALMIEGIYLLLCENITRQRLARADVVLHQFYQEYENLYGLNNMTLNLHNMCAHLVFYVRALGPMWAWSCFPFEDMNGSVLERLHGTGNVCRQILWNVHIQKRLVTDSKYISDFHRKQFVQNMVRWQRQVKVKLEAENCKIAGGLSVLNLDHNYKFKRKLATLLGIDTAHVGKVYKVLRIILSDQVIYAEEYTRMESRISNIVKIETNEEVLTASVQSFLLHEDSNVAVVKILESDGFLHPTINHIKLIRNMRDEQQLFDVSLIKEKLVFLNGNEQFPCIASLPNKLGLCG